MTPTIAHFDDPINPHGWALEPVIRQLRVVYPDLDWAYHPTVLVESWDTYEGPEIENGRQGMPATCAQLAEQSGMPIDEYLWFDDPPSTSVDACRALAAAETQDPMAARKLLRALREATFIRRTNISDEAQLRSVVASVPDLDSEAVWEAMDDGTAAAMVKKHQQTADAVDAQGTIQSDRLILPTLIVSDGDATYGLSGRRDSATYRTIIAEVTDEAPQEEAVSVQGAIERFSPFGWLSTTEIAELADIPYTAVPEQLGENTVEQTFASESFWRDAAFIGEDND